MDIAVQNVFFQSPPRRPVQLDNLNIQDKFGFLMDLLIMGSLQKYGSKFNIAYLTEDEFAWINDQYEEFGYDIRRLIKDMQEPPPISKADKTRLEDYSERFFNFETKTWHLFSFSSH